MALSRHQSTSSSSSAPTPNFLSDASISAPNPVPTRLSSTHFQSTSESSSNSDSPSGSPSEDPSKNSSDSSSNHSKIHSKNSSKNSDEDSEVHFSQDPSESSSKPLPIVPKILSKIHMKTLKSIPKFYPKILPKIHMSTLEFTPKFLPKTCPKIHRMIRTPGTSTRSCLLLILPLSTELRTSLAQMDDSSQKNDSIAWTMAFASAVENLAIWSVTVHSSCPGFILVYPFLFSFTAYDLF